MLCSDLVVTFSKCLRQKRFAGSKQTNKNTCPKHIDCCGCQTCSNKTVQIKMNLMTKFCWISNPSHTFSHVHELLI